MSPAFWINAARDLVLLVIGGLLTLAGTWLANRHASQESDKTRENEEQVRVRVRSEAATDARVAEDVERAKSLLLSLSRVSSYMIPEMYEGDREGFAVPRNVLAPISFEAELLHDELARVSARDGIWLVTGWRTLTGARRGFELDDNVLDHQWRVIGELRDVVSAVARDDPLPTKSTDWLSGNARELRYAEDLYAEGKLPLDGARESTE